MEKIFEKLIEKISKYDLFVGFASGIVLYYLIERFTILQFDCDDFIMKLGIYYILGICNCSVGYIVFNVFKFIRLFNDIEYTEFLNIDYRQNKVKILARNVSTYKAFIGAFITFIMLYYFQNYIYSYKRIVICLFVIVVIILLIAKICEQLEYLNKINIRNKKNLKLKISNYSTKILSTCL